MDISVGYYLVWLGTINLACATCMRRIPLSLYHRGLVISVKEKYLDPESLIPLRQGG